MKSIIFILSGIFFFSGINAQNKENFQPVTNLLTNPVGVQREDGSSIRYYLERKNNETSSKNLFLFLQGSDCNSVRSISLIDKLNAIYPDADMLTIEKYGITNALPYSMEMRDTLPDGYAEFDNPQQRVYDANKVIEALIKNYGYKKVLVLGGSEGATVAYILASENPYINATIAFGGGGRYFINDVIHSIKMADAKEEEKEKEIEGFKQYAQYIISNDSLNFTMSEHGFKYWKTMLSIDQQEIISRINTPTLILHGGKDLAASPEKTTEMVNELKQAGKSNIDYYFYPEYDHSLNFAVDEKAYERVMNDMQKWVQKILMND